MVLVIIFYLIIFILLTLFVIENNSSLRLVYHSIKNGEYTLYKGYESNNYYLINHNIDNKHSVLFKKISILENEYFFIFDFFLLEKNYLLFFFSPIHLYWYIKFMNLFDEFKITNSDLEQLSLTINIERS